MNILFDSGKPDDGRGTLSSLVALTLVALTSDRR
jgi:hypothetical protein